MSLFGKYLATNKNTLNNSPNSSIKSSSSSSQSSIESKPNRQHSNKFPMPNINNKSAYEKFEFKPLNFNPETSTPFLPNKNLNKSKSLNSNVTRSEKLVNNLVHNTSKNGKITKRKQEKISKKLNNHALLQCFNLTEKEKFRQLISGSLVSMNKPNTGFEKSDTNIYQNFIRSSPTKIQDDNLIDSRRKLNHSLVDKYNVNGTQLGKTISVGYSRRISLSNEVETISVTPLNKYSCKKKDFTIIELDITDIDSDSNSIKKSAQKRPTSHKATNSDENDHQLTFKPDSKNFNLSSYQNIAKVNRKLTEYEKRLNEKMSKNTSILETILKKSQTKSNALMIEEERYKLKKIQRLEKDKIEKELAFKFSQQLHLEANKLSSLYLDEVEEKIEIEDEFPVLTDEQEFRVKSALNATPGDEVLINGFGAGITRRDIHTLRGLNWLNDEIINFYMSLICERSQLDTENYCKVYAFTTFFYPKLVKDGFSSLRRWTRKVDLFSHDLLLIPVHLGLHWTLSVVDFTCREIRYYDSMNGNNNECLRALRSYLRDEYADKKSGSELDLSAWSCIHVKDIPQQMNGSDCGMFTCKYAEFLSRGKTVFNFNQSHMPYFRRRMIWEIINKKLI